FAQWVPVEGAKADESGLTMAMPPLANMTIDGGVSGLSWYVADGMAMLRYIGPDLDTQLNERVDERRMRRFSGQGSAPAGKRGTHVRGLGEQAATAEMKSNMPVASLDFAAKTEFMAKPARGAEEATAQYVAAKEQTEWRAQYMLDLSSPQGREFSAKYNDFLDIAEGEDAAVVYDDATGRSLSPGEKPKGKRTIARGYNMDRGDWAEMSKRIGLTPHEAQKVFNGERALTEGQKLRLNTILMEDTAKKVHAMYRPEKGFPPLPRAFYIARMSLYHHGVRNTPAMDKAIKAGDWDAVAMEIIDRSMKGFKGTVWEKGVQKRRLKEAVLATGGRSKDPRLVGVDPWKK
ncbi:MAG: hypothetical protein GWN58_41880, partial [Anaerolineae bacterium]|nr:hypothetical protein [Anaerolineae bacterium]